MATFIITCPCCNGRLTIDPGLEAVVAHEPPPRKSSGLGLGEAITSLKGEAAKREGLRQGGASAAPPPTPPHRAGVAAYAFS